MNNRFFAFLIFILVLNTGVSSFGQSTLCGKAPAEVMSQIREFRFHLSSAYGIYNINMSDYEERERTIRAELNDASQSNADAKIRLEEIKNQCASNRETLFAEFGKFIRP